jgi:hypothetical protein
VTGEEIHEQALDYVIARIRYSRDELSVLRSLPKGLQMIYTTHYLEADVNNGGFIQYFHNQGEEMARLAEEGYLFLGAKQHEKIVARAIEVYKQEQTMLHAYWNSNDPHGFSESYEHSKLVQLDDEFYEVESQEDPWEMRIRYLQQHPELLSVSMDAIRPPPN